MHFHKKAIAQITLALLNLLTNSINQKALIMCILNKFTDDNLVSIDSGF